MTLEKQFHKLVKFESCILWITCFEMFDDNDTCVTLLDDIINMRKKTGR